MQLTPSSLSPSSPSSLATISSASPSVARRLPRALGLCLSAALAAGAATAAPADLERVEITGQRPGEVVHTNVRQICPGVEASLLSSLSRTHYYGGKEGITTVSFRLSGNDIGDIRQRGGPYDYRDTIHRAVRRLQCQTAGSDQLYVMQIAFRNDDADPAAPQRFALLD